jgi:hypothetical protein
MRRGLALTGWVVLAALVVTCPPVREALGKQAVDKRSVRRRLVPLIAGQGASSGSYWCNQRPNGHLSCRSSLRSIRRWQAISVTGGRHARTGRSSFTSRSSFLSGPAGHRGWLGGEVAVWAE